MKLADRRGNIEECSSGQDRLLEWIYTHETGRFLMKGLINPHISEIGAAFLAQLCRNIAIACDIRIWQKNRARPKGKLIPKRCIKHQQDNQADHH